MAEFEETIVLVDRDLLEVKFPDVVFKKFSERMDKISLTNDPNASSSSKDNVETLSVQQTSIPFQSTIDVTHGIKSESTCVGKARARSSLRRSARLATKARVASDPFDRILSNLTDKRLYSQHNGRWIDWPLTNKAGLDEELSKYLNRVVDTVRVFLNDGTKPKEDENDWVYSASCQVSTFQSEFSERKLDIAIIKRKYANEATSSSKLKSTTWNGIRSFGELKSASRNDQDIIVGKLTEYARLCFGHEKARHFVLCFTIKSDVMQLIKFDRSGVVLSREFNVHENPHDFLRIIVGMIISDEYYLGLDPTFVVEEGKTWVYLNEERYELEKTLLQERTNRGRGTVALLVRTGDGKEMAIKDQWVDRSRKSKEPDLLRDLKSRGVLRIAIIKDHQIFHYMVEGKSVKDTTEHDRSSESDVETRDHYGLLKSPYGDQLETFRSRKELISTFKDYVEVVEELIDEDVVHRDISPGNVILVKDPKIPKTLRKGYIIDFDYAIQQSRQDDDHAEGRRTGTYPFMSIAVLEDLYKANETHSYCHDLESLFYALVWTCITHKGPNSAERSITDYEFYDSPIHYWIGKPDKTAHRSIANMKCGMMLSWESFEIYGLAKMTKYFTPLEELLESMREIIFRQNPSPITRAGKSLADIPDYQKKMRDREPANVFKEIKAHLNEALKLKEIQDEDSAIEKNQQDIDSTKHQQAVGGDASGIGSRFLKLNNTTLPPRNETHCSDRLDRKAISQSRSMRDSSQVTGKRAREVVAD